MKTIKLWLNGRRSRPKGRVRTSAAMVRRLCCSSLARGWSRPAECYSMNVTKSFTSEISATQGSKISGPAIVIGK